MKTKNRKKAVFTFALTLLLIIAVFGLSLIKTSAYNRAKHHAVFAGEALFSDDNAQAYDVKVTAVPRSSTWGKIFDFNDEGLTENNYQAYTYDFTVSNNTRDTVKSFTFTLDFGREVFLSSAWNGALELHQSVNRSQLVTTIPDLREFSPVGLIKFDESVVFDKRVTETTDLPFIS